MNIIDCRYRPNTPEWMATFTRNPVYAEYVKLTDFDRKPTQSLAACAAQLGSLGIGKAPVTTMSFAQDVANPSVAALQSLTIGALELTPAFAVGTDTYTATTSNASDVLSAVPTMGSTLKIKLAGKTLQNGAPAYWSDGTNVVTITVVNGANTKTYTVTVTKS